MRNLANLATGEKVLVQKQSHMHPDVRPIIHDVLKRVTPGNGRRWRATVDMGRIVGEDVCVETNKGDYIVYAQRKGRANKTRFVRNRKAVPTQFVSVVLQRQQSGTYVLVTAFIGKSAEPEPWDRRATRQSRRFWATHALVWGSQPVVKGTEQRHCPW